MSDECRPAAGALNPQAYKKAFRAVDRLPSNAGAPGLDGLTHAVTETAIRAYLRHLPASPDDATERARLVDENARLRAVADAAQEVATAVDCLETARTVPQQRQFTDEIIDAAKKLADALAALTPGDAS